ncbi:MAG: hypothetical protein LWW91_09305 [Bacteroidales bacterium]|nr:hypothetical protein [Bacteroidales bacterium]OJX83747.1 MAG: hypothetical protein BGP01_10000 [Paludibacter sp. 47-17]
MKETVFKVAECAILVRSEHDFELEEGYLPFVVEAGSELETDSPPEVVINVVPLLPEGLISGRQLLFDAENEQQKFYSIYQMEDGLGFVIYDQQTRNDVQQVALLNKDFTNWTVYFDTKRADLFPLKYPFGPIMLHYLTLKIDAVMMHASCAFDGKKGRLFSGFSGVGKSTISKLWAQEGSRIINDDRLIVRRHNGGYRVYNTPMYYQDIPKVAPLGGIFLIRHFPENTMCRIKGAGAVSKVMAYSIQNNFDRRYVAQRLAFFSELVSQIPVFELGFVPDVSVVRYILEHEDKQEAGETR